MDAKICYVCMCPENASGTNLGSDLHDSAIAIGCEGLRYCLKACEEMGVSH
jgi:hypothetical protein